jgi:D-alanyl-D-alanine carboxypeptidase
MTRVGRLWSLAAVAILMVTALVWAASTAPHRATSRPQALATWQQRTGVTGVVAGTLDARGRWLGAAGRVRRGAHAPMRTGDCFRIASITKLFVATVVLQLVREGRLRLDDPLSTYLPSFPRARDITLTELLDHTSGVPDYEQVEGFGRGLVQHRDRIWKTSQLLSIAAHRRPEFAPGTDYAYSNSDYLLLGEVVRVATHRTWAAQVRARILDPLRLTHTYIAGVEAGPPVVPGYFDVNDDGAEENVETAATWPAQSSAEGPAGAIVSTAGDLLTFGDALFHGRVVPARLLRLMVQDRPLHPRFSNYGLGVEIQRPDYRTVWWGHGGFLPGFRTDLRYLPARDQVVVVLTDDSAADPDDLTELLADASPAT